jgi:hypothetical protein
MRTECRINNVYNVAPPAEIQGSREGLLFVYPFTVAGILGAMSAAFQLYRHGGLVNEITASPFVQYRNIIGDHVPDAPIARLQTGNLRASVHVQRHYSPITDFDSTQEK